LHLLFIMSNFNLSNSDALLLNGEGTQNCAENQLLDNRTATADNTKSPKIMTFPEFPNSTDDGNVKLPDCPIREDNNIASFVNKNSENSMGELLSSINEFDCNFEKNGNTEAHPCNWPSGIFADDGLVNDSNVLHAADGIDRSRWSAFSPVFDFNAEAYLNLVPEMVQNQYAPQYDAHADDGDRDCNHQKQLLTEEVSNIDVPLVTDHLTQNVCTTSNDFTSPSCLIQNFQQNENGLHIENLPNPQIQSDTFEAAAVFFVDNVMQTFPENTFEIHPIEDTSAPSNVVQSITGDVDGSRWSAFSPAFDFNAETYFSSEPEMVLIMNDQHAPQYDAYANDGDRDCNNQKQLLTEEVSNIDVPLVTDHLTQNVCTTSNDFTSPSCFIQNFQQNENGLHTENLPNPQIQSDTFESAAGFLIDNVMQTFPESPLGMHPLDYSFALSSVAENNTEGTLQNEAHGDERNTDYNNQKQPTNELISNVDVLHPAKDVAQNVGTTSIGFTPSFCFTEDVQQNANEPQNIENQIKSAPDSEMQINTFEGVGDCSTDSATHNTQLIAELQMHELHEKNVKNTTYACFQCQKPFENISDLCKHINQCLQNYKDLASDTNQSALAESCSQAKHQPGEALEKSQWKMCDVCKKLFSCYSALHIHYRSHTKETPYQCDICGRRFTTKFSKNRHLESQHFVKRPRCYKSRKS
ncbi:Homeotic protein spalt-major, partial [Trichinella pseudospiralis]